MSSSLIIYFTPHTNMTASAIIALADLALKHGISVADTPSFMGFDDYTALLIAAEAVTEDDFRQVMDVLQQWCILIRPSGTFELSIRVESINLYIEQALPVEGCPAIAALLVNLVKAVRMLKESDLLGKVTRILVPPSRLHAELRADIGRRLAYLIAPESGTLRKVRGSETLPRL
jgi:hypothetical protein